VKRFALTLAALVTMLAGTMAAQQPDEASIPQQLRDSGSFERVVVAPYEPLQLADLVGQSELIVEASTPGGRSFLTPSGRDIYTDYAFQVHTVLKNTRSPELRIGHAITVRRNSGLVVIDGRAAVSQENDFPLFERNEHYILFLARARDENLYFVLGGPQGAFSLRDGVRQTSIDLGDWSNKHGVLARAAFFDEVRALLKFSS